MDPDNHLVFVGTENGIYVSNNVESQNPTWISQNQNIGRVPVFMLKQQTIRKQNDTVVTVGVDTTIVVYEGTNNYGVIYGASFGRGIIRLDEFQKPVGISEPGDHIVKDLDFKIYPNPASERTWIDFTLIASSKVSLSLYNLNGQLVKTREAGYMPSGKHNISLDVGDLPGGTYILRIRAGNQSSSKKIIVY